MKETYKLKMKHTNVVRGGKQGKRRITLNLDVSACILEMTQEHVRVD